MPRPAEKSRAWGEKNTSPRISGISKIENDHASLRTRTWATKDSDMKNSGGSTQMGSPT